MHWLAGGGEEKGGREGKRGEEGKRKWGGEGERGGVRREGGRGREKPALPIQYTAGGLGDWGVGAVNGVGAKLWLYWLGPGMSSS